MGDRPPQARAAPRRRQRDAHRAADPRLRALPGRGRDGPRAGTRPGTSSTSPRTAPSSAHDATAQWLEQIGLPYDELYCSYDKVTRCEEIGIDLLIDDSPENLQRAIDAGITVATIEHPWNRELCETEDVVCGEDWAELARNLEPVLGA